MGRELSLKEETLAKAAVVFCQRVYEAFPGSIIQPLDHHYSDEELTLEVQVATGADVRRTSDELIRLAIEVENEYGVTILARVVKRREAEEQ